MNPWLLAPLVFVTAAVLDVFWARYTLRVAEKNARASAGWAALIYLPNALSIPAIVASRFYVIPLALGAAVGTYLTVRRS